MIGRRIASSLFFAALLALLAWAFLTGNLKKYLAYPLRWLGIEQVQTVDGTVDEDILFDDDSTVDWSDPAPDTDVFESSETSEKAPVTSYEFLLNPEYFNALLEKYASGLPIRDLTASFEGDRVVLSGNARVSELSSLFNIPPAIVLFLPESVPCRLYCLPKVDGDRIRVTVVDVKTDYSVLSPFLQQEGILSSVEGFLNDQIKKYLPSNYKMKTASVSPKGLLVTFLVENPEQN